VGAASQAAFRSRGSRPGLLAHPRVGERPEMSQNRAPRDRAQRGDPQGRRLLEWRLERFPELGFQPPSLLSSPSRKRTATSRPRSRRRAVRSSCCARSSSGTAPAVFTVVKPRGVQKLCHALSRRRTRAIASSAHLWRSCVRHRGARGGDHRARLHADDCNSTARVGRHSRANRVRAKALALSVRRWRWGVRPTRQRGTAQFRCTACGYGVSMAGALPTCPMCRKRAWERVPAPTLLRNEGEAVNGRARRRSSNTRSVWP
jgi:hypothetical protein